MPQPLDLRVSRGHEEFGARWVGQSTQHLNTGRDREVTEYAFQYEVVADATTETHALRISDFAIERAREYGFNLLEDSRAMDELFALMFSKAISGSREHVVSFGDLDSLRARGKGKVQ